MPDIEERFWKTYGSEGLAVIGVDPDPEDYPLVGNVQEFADNVGVTFPVGVEDTETYEALRSHYDGANPYPVDVIVDKQGIIRYVAREYDPAAMELVIQELLQQ